MSSPILAKSAEAIQTIAERLPEALGWAKVGIICGSGLGGLAATLHAQPRFELAYTDIPHFPHSTVEGHAGKFVFGRMGNKGTPVVVMVGRVHYYEGHDIQKITFPIRVMDMLGVTTLIVTNAAGGLNSGFSVGDVMVLNDHINFPGLAGVHPLRGPNEEGYMRFLPMSDAYDLQLRKAIHQSYRKLDLAASGRKLHEGVYVFISGPTFETRAECRMLRLMGADVVGMSTVPEIIIARHCGMRVLAMSLVTNRAVLEPGPRGDSLLVDGMPDSGLNGVMEAGKANHEEVLEMGASAAGDLQALVRQFVDDIAI